MNIKILGPGCAKCHKLEAVTREAVNELGLDAEVEYIKDMARILEYPIIMTPGLVINERVVLSGQVPSKEKVKEMIKAAARQEGGS